VEAVVEAVVVVVVMAAEVVVKMMDLVIATHSSSSHTVVLDTATQHNRLRHNNNHLLNKEAQQVLKTHMLSMAATKRIWPSGRHTTLLNRWLKPKVAKVSSRNRLGPLRGRPIVMTARRLVILIA
jgi:hypothetical protein